MNNTKPDEKGGNPDLNGAKPEINEGKPEVVRREGKSSKPRRKRDSSTLFDISLDDLTEPDHSGFLTEKHSGKEWWCVLQDQHLCMFPSQNPQELAYDVLLVPCCEISLDDVYTESPVFRLTQVGSTPWVFSAGIERNLRAWIRALYRACGRDDADWSMRSSKKGRGRKGKNQKRNMKVLTSTIDESEEVEETGEEAEQMNGATVEEEKALEDGTNDKETRAEKDVKHENGMKASEGNEKDEMKAEESGQQVGHENELKIEGETETKESIKLKEMEKKAEHENGVKMEEWKGGNDGRNRKENKEIKIVDNEEKLTTGENDHQTGKNIEQGLIPRGKNQEFEFKSREELPKEQIDNPEGNRPANGNENLNEAKKDQQQDDVCKTINESEIQELIDDKQEMNNEVKPA
jgi:hypothetical protein